MSLQERNITRLVLGLAGLGITDKDLLIQLGEDRLNLFLLQVNF